ncbi:MAG: hypothetical protein N3D84_00160 [Candidatus Woesearchaeota archaeon]|nr:hypothetical protein [Candidatus Woesearchaeota archaeon]
MAIQKYEKTGNKNVPEKKFKAGAVSATVWKNIGQRDGKTVEFRTISIDRRYMDKNNSWQSTSSLRLNDLPKAVVVLQQAYEYLVLKEQDIEGATI